MPEAQLSQVLVSMLAKLPGSHSAQLTAPPAETAPGEHGLHADVPEVDE